MANLCYYEMKVVGTHENVNTFCEKLEEAARLYWGTEVVDEWCDDDRYVRIISGDCAWSIRSAMVDRKTSIVDLTAAYDVAIEAYSSEAGFAFQEHYIIDRGDILEEEVVDWKYIYNDEDGSVEEEGGFADWEFRI